MYILDYSCISPQSTFDDSFLNGDVVNYEGIQYNAIEPSYKETIPRGLLRRMGKSVRFGVGAGIPLLKEHENIDAIIIGTATGGIDNCITFLNQIIQYEEGTLTPTHFVQSTPNSIAGHLALMTKNVNYNCTHNNDGLAFEGALVDAMLLFSENEANLILVGSVDEDAGPNFNVEKIAGYFKEEVGVNSLNLFDLKTKGSVKGEGAAMFVLSNKIENSIAEIVDVHQFSFPKINNIEERALDFLKKNNIDKSQIDGLMLGLNGDNRFDSIYHDFADAFKESAIFTFKNMVGDYPTATGFATWLSCQIIQGKPIPSQAIYKSTDTKVKTILIYNNYYGRQHAFHIIRAVS